MQNIQVQVNATNLLENLRFAFTKSITVISELLQNARRAGASKVELTYHEEDKTFAIYDDGCGIADFQSLLTVAESGWCDEIKNTEHPYGLGFLAALYSCDRIEAESIGGSVSFETAHAISFGEIPVAGDKISEGTRIVLSGFQTNVTEYTIGQMVKGFPIPVFFNGQEMPRPDSMGSLESCYISELGHFTLHGLHTGSKDTYTDNTAIYLQGFKVHDTSRWAHFGEKNIVHLDPTMFNARMPDRDCLIDSAAAVNRIKAEIRRIWAEHLRLKASELDNVTFLRRYEGAVMAVDRTIFDDIPLLPKKAVLQYLEAPNQKDVNGWCCDTFVSREDVESGNVRLCTDMKHCYEDNLEAMMFAYLGKYLGIDNSCLGPNHWALKHIRDLESESFEVEVFGEIGCATYAGSWTSGTVVICDCYAISSVDGNDKVYSETEAFYRLAEDMFIFPGDSRDGSVIKMASSYEHEDQFEEDAYNQDYDDIVRVILQLRGGSPQEILASILSDTYWKKYAFLHGKNFKLSFDTEGKLTVAEC